ncbi:MAG TPA: nucleotidyltransferase domain-containing protein [Chthoniobacterales bacterium]|nr:nucleotidyltransferase domain-containing protein [Chthoniobacterales bacterium]
MSTVHGSSNLENIQAAAFAISSRLQEKLGAEEVYLFGSYARGEAARTAI